MMSTKWQKFGKVAAAIRRAERGGASVKWNTRLAGNRFDAALHSRHGDREYLIVIDCVDHVAPVTAATVRSFAVKAEAAGAHMGIMASASEYLEEAIDLTGDHGVFLLDWKTISRYSEEELADSFKPARLASDFRFRLDGSGEELAIPEDPPVLRFLMREIRVEGPGVVTTPERLAHESYGEVWHGATGKPRRHEILLPRGTVMVHPNTKTRTPVRAFSFAYRLIPKAEVIDPEAYRTDSYGIEASLVEELAKRNPSADPSKIETGFDTVLRPGGYYYSPSLKFSYYCEEVRDGEARLVMVESHQNGELLQGRATLPSASPNQFVEITERGEVDRLAGLYETFRVSEKNPEGRFKVFLRDLGGAESIDDLPLTPEQRRAGKATYFFAGRAVIGEFMALHDHMIAKMGAALARYRGTPEWPHLSGEQELEKILRYLPARDKIRARILASVTRPIEAAVQRADSRIRSTKEVFGLPEAGGLLIILNDAADTLSPDLIAYRVGRAIRKRTPEGGPKFPHVSAVAIIGTAHYTWTSTGLGGVPTRIISNVVPAAAPVAEFIQELNRKWAEFDLELPTFFKTEGLPKFNFRKLGEDAEKAAHPLTRQDYWSLLYRRNPYLRGLGEGELLDFGAKALEGAYEPVMNGAPKVPMEVVEPRMIRWNQFVDEAKHRGLDLSEFVKKAAELRAQVEALD